MGTLTRLNLEEAAPACACGHRVIEADGGCPERGVQISYLGAEVQPRRVRGR